MNVFDGAPWPPSGVKPGTVWGAYRLDWDGWWRLRPVEPGFVHGKCLILFYLFLVCTVLWPVELLWYWWKFRRTHSFYD